jgi:K+-sensing histidine kinase KdpD
MMTAFVLGCWLLPGIDHATVALFMVMGTVGLATVWGREEALTGALIGAIGYVYYFLPPRGRFYVARSEHVSRGSARDGMASDVLKRRLHNPVESERHRP